MRLEEKLEIAVNLAKQRSLTSDNLKDLILSKNTKQADLSFSCHALANESNISPKELGDRILSNLDCNKILDKSNFSSIENINGFLNFNYKPEILVNETLSEVLSLKSDYGRNDSGNGKTVIVDYSAPNIGKPLHIGHIRSTIIGDSIIKLLNFSGYKTHGINYLGDTGLHLGKLITAYTKWGDESAIKKEPEKEMLNLYVRFGKESKTDSTLEIEAKKILKSIETGEPNYISTLSKIQDLSMVSFQRIYDILNVSFDETTGQSHFSEVGKGIVEALLRKGIAKTTTDTKQFNQEFSMEENESSGVIVDLEEFNLPSKVVLRSDGTAIYSTQDLGSAVTRHDVHNFDKMIYVVANEQELYFRQLFSILKKSGNDWAKDCHHLSFGLINMENEKISSREGNVVFLEDVLNRSIDFAKQRLLIKSGELAENFELSKSIGVGAIKYGVLQVDPVKDITFSWEKFLDFEGNSAPYIQYAFARATRVMEKSNKYPFTFFKPEELVLQKEKELVKIINQFPDYVSLAQTKLKPNIICNYAYNLASRFNEFYKDVKVLGQPEEQSRLALIEATRITLQNASYLMGIDLPNKM